MTATFLTAEWRKIIMAQYEAGAATLAPWLPRGLELDTYEGRHYISLVGFLFDRVRVKGLAIPFHRRFEEVNLRFYVTRTEPDGTRKRGVVFIREFAPRAAIALLANWLYEERYSALPMRHSIQETTDSLDVSYGWRYRDVWQNLEVSASPTPQPIENGSLEEFITEHYWGYTERSKGPTSEYGVQHPRWEIYPMRSFSIDTNFTALYGPAFAPFNGLTPASVLLAEGSEVSVLAGTRLPE